MKTPTDLSNIPEGADGHTGLEDFAAEVAAAVFPRVLRRRPMELWVKVELGLWRALTETVKTRTRQRSGAESAEELEDWWEGLVVDLTETAFYVALKNGIKGSLLDLELCLYRAVRLVTRKYSRIRKSVRYS